MSQVLDDRYSSQKRSGRLALALVLKHGLRGSWIHVGVSLTAYHPQTRTPWIDTVRTGAECNAVIRKGSWARLKTKENRGRERYEGKRTKQTLRRRCQQCQHCQECLSVRLNLLKNLHSHSAATAANVGYQRRARVVCS